MELKELFKQIEARLLEAANEHYDPEDDDEVAQASVDDIAKSAGIMEALEIVQTEFGKAILS